MAPSWQSSGAQRAFHEGVEKQAARQTCYIFTKPAGITGIETAIVRIAFAVRNTGILSEEKSKEATLGGLEETSATLSLRGHVIAVANAGTTSVDTVKFTIAPASTASETVDLSNSGTVITYLDEDQGINRGYPQSYDGDAATAECS